jgi:magnesium transporter
MRKMFKKSSKKKAGMSPGSLIHVGEQKVSRVTMSLINYDQERVEQHTCETTGDMFARLPESGISWLNITGLHDTGIIQEIGDKFGINALNLEDILNTDQRPKCEIYDDYVYIVMKMIAFDPVRKEIDTEQISLILGENYVISFQEREGDDFEPIRRRLQNSKGRHRRYGADYLLYAMMDVIIDNYYVILEQIGTAIEDLDGQILTDPDHDRLPEIQNFKREILMIRKSIWPLREVVNELQSEETDLITEPISPYLRDLYDHTIQVVETVEIFREMTANIMDLYLSNLSTRMNEVMKVLTIIATIFIPLTFIAGIYGMNFEVMPELHWKFGYPFAWGIMLAIAGVLILYFRKKRWL